MQASVPASSKPSAARWLLLLGIAAAEITMLAARYEAPPLPPYENDWTAKLLHFSKEVWPAGLWMAGACCLILSPRLKTILANLREHAIGYRWQSWLIGHLLALAGFAGFTQLIFGIPRDPAYLTLSWLAGWAGMASATVFSWMLALAPGRFWQRLAHREYAALLAGCLLGAGAQTLIVMLGQFETSLLGQSEFWNILSTPTLHVVHTLLGWIYTDLVIQPENFILGTPSFHVKISYACSGIEGISLITLFLALYLWLFRKELRFPHVFWLFPLGIAAVWLANTVRIALLIAIGTSFSPETAIQGFHAQAGWIIFTLIAIGAIALSNRLQCFTLTQPGLHAAAPPKNPAAALLLPLLALMAATMVTSAFFSGFDGLYPLRMAILAATLYYFRNRYRNLGWTWTWHAPAVGTAVFMLWMLLEPDAAEGATALAEGLAGLPNGAADAWLVCRVLGSVIAVPLAEELTFRGYLLRKLIAKDFESVPLGRLTLASFLLTSVLFGLLHERWFAGTLAGMGYALVLHRRGQMGDAVIAHMTTNALIAVVVLTQARWSLWA
jgi:exosortase E/protease (VPEID-CTERM system)